MIHFMAESPLSDLFSQIGTTVQDIMHSQTVSDLKQSIDVTIRDVKSAIDTGATNYRTSASGVQTNYRTGSSPAPGFVSNSTSPPAQPAPTLAVPETLALPAKKIPGRISGVLLAIAGLSCAIISGIVALALIGAHSWTAEIAPFVCVAAGSAVAARGFALTGRADRYRIYLRELRGVTFCAIPELASAVHKSAKYVARDLERMIRRNFFYQGHLDAQKTTFILDHATYQQYQALAQRAEEEKRQQSARAANPELDRTIREGRACIRQIREANDAIPGEVISQKLDRLENAVSRIFQFIEEHPERLGEVRRFNSYYLPTTLKLVAAYREFDMQKVQGETIQSAKKEIEDTLDLINQAFETMYDHFFENDARDVSADISVLHTMLRQEGLNGDELHADPQDKPSDS